MVNDMGQNASEIDGIKQACNIFFRRYQADYNSFENQLQQVISQT